MRCAGAVILTALGSALLLAAPAVAQQDGGARLDALAWLEGTWQRETSRGVAVERWSRVSAATMEGTADVTSAGATRITEHLRLVQLGSEIFYLAKPAENPLPTPFRLTEWTDSSAVFENRGHDFPQRIIYRRRGPDTLVARIEGPVGSGGDGRREGIDFRFTRRAAP